MSSEKIIYCCGPSYFPEWLRKHLSKRFDLVCKIHDEEYTYKKVSRKESDRKFLEGMVLLSESMYDRILAYTYYYIVRLFGWTRYGKE